MAYPNKGEDVPVSAVVATQYVRKMIQHGDAERSMTMIEAKYGIGFWTLDHLRKGRAKSVETGLFMRIRAAYLDFCQGQVAKLQHEIALEKAINTHDDLEDLEAEAEALAARIQAKKARMK